MRWDGSRAPDLDCTRHANGGFGLRTLFLFESSLLNSACRSVPVSSLAIE
jgi:hypothetical protein